VFFTDSGSECADTAVKMVRAYWRLKGQSTKTKMIGRARGYHGVNIAGTSLGGVNGNRKMFGQAMMDVDHLPHTLLASNAFSRGMLQRLGIAQALINDPMVVVLDEPASGLDPVGQRDVRNLMLELRDGGVSVLLSSHQLSEVEAVCDEVTIMNAGLVAAEGQLDALLNVEGRTSIRVRGLDGGLPPAVRALAEDVAASGGVWVFSVADASVRAVVDAVDDAGGTIVSVSPVRDSLEEYFARLLTSSPGEVGSR